ncbi:methylated-DNA--[protein]-cysteine S-methyltransferase [Helicobacter winghamensis]|uniref:methylated-DNA--[protein]-cysteine S-methyltransferase n=1 Tax=Helicobacter winghamensis TaxID=157268 RepID=UPI0027A1F653
MQYTGIQNSPLGEILVVDDGKAILEVRFLDFTLSPHNKNFSIKTQFKKSAFLQSNSAKESCKQSSLTLASFSQIEEYFAQKRKVFTLPLNPKGTAFQKSVWEILRTIPYGEILSYGEVAKRLNKPNSARAIGGANHNNPIAIFIPCHRVINANGSINGYASGIQKKIELLKLEGYTPKKGLRKL